jgi:hypothetical protein
MKKNENHLTRRKLIKNAALAGLAGALTPLSGLAQTTGRKPEGLVAIENSKPGTPEWQLQYTRFDDPITLASYPLIRNTRAFMLEGYVSRTSLYPGESIDFKVSEDPGGKFHIDIYRMGYYGGIGGRHMAHLGSFTGRPQPMPMMTVERLRECNWETATTFTIPKDWPSGVYLGKLSRDENYGKQSYVIFVVKERRRSDILFQVSDLTWQSYNKWPGKDSLYDDGTPEVWYTGPNVRVSFDRPYAKYCQILDAPLSAGSGEFLLWEHPLAYWLEKEGYDVTYCSNLDLHLDPDILSRSKAFISVGHDEYWSRKMFDEAIKARDNGLSFAFFSGNSLSGEINMFDSSITGEPCRAFSRNKKFEGENLLMGNSSYGPGYGDWVVKNSGHWIYEGTGLKDGDKIPAMIGWEYHGPPHANIPGLVEVAGTVAWQFGDPAASKPGKDVKLHSGVVYPGPKGNWVFNAGTIWWPEALSQPPGHIPAGYNPEMRTFGVNPLIQKITSNILNRMIKDSPRK